MNATAPIANPNHPPVGIRAPAFAVTWARAALVLVADGATVTKLVDVLVAAAEAASVLRERDVASTIDVGTLVVVGAVEIPVA